MPEGICFNCGKPFYSKNKNHDLYCEECREDCVKRDNESITLPGNSTYALCGAIVENQLKVFKKALRKYKKAVESGDAAGIATEESALRREIRWWHSDDAKIFLNGLNADRLLKVAALEVAGKPNPLLKSKAETKAYTNEKKKLKNAITKAQREEHENE